jgi:hypothetical protein
VAAWAIWTSDPIVRYNIFVAIALEAARMGRLFLFPAFSGKRYMVQEREERELEW